MHEAGQSPHRTGHESNDQTVRVMRSSAPELLAQRWVRQGLHLVCVVSADSYLSQLIFFGLVMFDYEVWNHEGLN